jgi:hypothetical protein
VGCTFVGNNNTKGNNDITRADATSNVTFACPNGTAGAAVVMSAGNSELTNPPPAALKCTAVARFLCDVVNHKCIQSPQGTASKSDCESHCALQYDCNPRNHTCILATPGTGVPLEQCKQQCVPPPTPPPANPHYKAEQQALIAFQKATSQGDGWITGCKAGWPTPTPAPPTDHCAWYGVTCSPGSYVVKVALSGCGLASRLHRVQGLLQRAHPGWPLLRCLQQEPVQIGKPSSQTPIGSKMIATDKPVCIEDRECKLEGIQKQGPID